MSLKNDIFNIGEFPWMVAVLKKEKVKGMNLNLYQK